MIPEETDPFFSLTPLVEGVITWNENSDQLIFTPDKNWPAGETVELSISSGAPAKIKLPLLGTFQTSLRISPFLLSYLWPADGPSNLYITNPETGEGQALTNEIEGILDYSIHPDGLSILYSLSNDNGGSSIVLLDRISGNVSTLIECQTELCLGPKLSPDGVYLAYEVISSESDSQPGIMIQDLSNQKTIYPGLEDDYLEKPLWSSTGWLSFYNQTQKGFEFWNPQTEEKKFLTNDTGGIASWSGDGRYFVCSEIKFTSQTLAPRHLILYDLNEETILDLSQGNFLEDLNPSLGPSGLILAYSRKSLDPQNWSPGRQLWVMDIASGQDQPLTDEVDYHHTSFAWHPDGKRLAFVRYNQAALSDPPEIWLIMADGSDRLRLIINGFAPTWIP
jgi:Tol biopolymer transport system component